MEKPKILIVDDKLANIISMETLLNEFKVEFIRAQSGQEALRCTLDNEFALILIDVHMPNMDGYETIELLRQVEKTKYIPVIFVSAVYSSDFYQIKGIKSGAVDFIVKPIKPEVLIGKVQIFLDIYLQKKNLEIEIELRKHIEKVLEAHKNHLELINQILRHDLLNNLTVIKSGFRLFKENQNIEIFDESYEYIEKSVTLINRMKQLENFIGTRKDLLPINLNKHLNEIISKYKKIDFQINGSSHILADEAIESVFDNIIRNAVVHGRTERIIIDIHKMGRKCEVRIADEGKGIPDNIQGKIFNKDFQFGKMGHTGIGLYIVKSAMDRYGGSISVKNNEPKGAVFILEFLNVG